MKKITAYIRTIRVHWLVEELQHLGINEIMVTEFFRPTSQISRLELCCEDHIVETVRTTVHQVGTTGDVPDHDVIVSEYDPSLPGQIPIGMRMSRLQESRIRQLVNVLLKGMTGRLSIAFLVLSASIVAVGFYVHARIGTLREHLESASRSNRVTSETAHQIQHSVLLEMLAAERLHRGEVGPAVRDFQVARGELKEALEALKRGGQAPAPILDSIVVVERRFQSVVGGMFAIIDQLSTSTLHLNKARASALATTHQAIMSALERDRLHLLKVLESLERGMREHSAALEADVERAMADVQGSLTILSVLAGAITVATWLVAERKVARPLQVLVEEAKTIDTGDLR